MNYTDGVFFLFYIVTFVAYYLVKNARLQVLILLSASLIFYAYQSAPLLAVFLLSWLTTSLSSYGILTANNSRRAKLFSTIGVLTNLGLLGFFKYKFLVLHNLPALFNKPPQTMEEWLILAPLPIGISFYTFHGISLLIDVYRRNAAISPEMNGPKHFTDTLFYLVFFPQLIAGPIIKAKDFYPQVGLKRVQDVDFSECFHILILGFFLKVVIADNLSEQTFWIAYPYFQWKSSINLLVLLYGYSAQIFADFAGYSLIAIGLAKLLGYKLPDNFNFPYLSGSISEFWRKWHISLSSWLRDYLYIPLGGSKKGVVRTYVNLIIVMFLGGLWHGAAWSFAVWGLWHGIGLAIERPWLDSRFMTSTNPLLRGIRIFLVFNFVSIGWLFFKLQDFSQALSYIGTMIKSDANSVALRDISLIGIYSSAVLFYHLISTYKSKMPRFLNDAIYGAMLFLILTNPGPSKPFIYFQF